MDKLRRINIVKIYKKDVSILLNNFFMRSTLLFVVLFSLIGCFLWEMYDEYRNRDERLKLRKKISKMIEEHIQNTEES
jgi:hypothetical protein